MEVKERQLSLMQSTRAREEWSGTESEVGRRTETKTPSASSIFFGLAQIEPKEPISEKPS